MVTLGCGLRKHVRVAIEVFSQISNFVFCFLQISAEGGKELMLKNKNGFTGQRDMTVTWLLL